MGSLSVRVSLDFKEFLQDTERILWVAAVHARWEASLPYDDLYAREEDRIDLATVMAGIFEADLAAVKISKIVARPMKADIDSFEKECLTELLGRQRTAP